MMNRIMDVIINMMTHAGSNSGFLYFFFFGSSIFFSSSIIITCGMFLIFQYKLIDFIFSEIYLLKPFWSEVPTKTILAIVPSSAITASSQKIGPNTWWCTTEPITRKQSFANPRLILKWRGLSLITASIILVSLL